MDVLFAVDQSTSGTKAALLDGGMRIARRQTLPHRQHYPGPGLVEHDAAEILSNTIAVLRAVMEDTPPADIAALALANQRETLVVWRRDTGEPACPAVVWQDVRGAHITGRLAPHAPLVYARTGLPLSPYFTAAKLAAVLEANAGLRAQAHAGALCAGTVDSFLLWHLTGGKMFATDVSNASRTQLMNLRTLAWDADICGLFGIPTGMLAGQILHSDADFGRTACEGLPGGIPIRAALGDSHASLFGHGCHEAGMVKTSYGTGSSIMMNIGATPMASQNGLSTSVGYGFGGEVKYVLEGNITCSADTLVWLRDALCLIGDIAEIEPLAASVEGTQGVYLVPAFSGLGTPYYDERARAILCGMSRGTTRAHVLRAALASIAHQNADVLDAMRRDALAPVTRLKADGGASVNRLLMQLQSDYVPCRVDRVAEKDLTLLGAGAMAGLACGLYAAFTPPIAADTYAPRMDEIERQAQRQGWADAVARAQYQP